MHSPPVCPRCDGDLTPPGLWSSRWRCEAHGAVEPLHPAPAPSPRGVTQLAGQARVPVWLPDPLPPGWLLAGHRHCGDERTGATATVVAGSGPNPLGGPAELLVVAEEPGVGLGARLAGLPGPDPGEALAGAPAAKVLAAGHPTPLWALAGCPQRAVFVGEGRGSWLWLVFQPPSAGLVLLEDLILRDARDGGPEPEVGALSPLLG